MQYKQLDTNVFLIETHFKGVFIIFFPLQKKAFWTKDISQKDIIMIYDNYLKSEKISNFEIEQKINYILNSYQNEIYHNDLETNYFDRAVILLTDMCNMGCRYCYSKDTRFYKNTLSMNKITKVVDMILDNNSDRKKCFTFLGGGEPTIQWELLKESIEYIRDKGGLMNVSIGIQTNGTLIGADKIVWIKEHKVNVGCSFDVLPHIQNKQRPFLQGDTESFNSVDDCIKTMLREGIIPSIRTTITADCCSLMPEMIRFLAKEYKGVNQVHFEHVSAKGLNWANYYKCFYSSFYVAKRIAKRYGIVLNNSTIKSLDVLRNQFCSGELCVAPNGDIIACHRVSSKNNMYFDEYNYGLVNDDGIYINKNKLHDICNHYKRYIKEECNYCFGKYHCAGQCFYNKLLYSNEEFNELCKFTQEMMLRELEEILEIQ